jgi:hypothetical protein
MVKWTNIILNSFKVEITFKLLYEETNNVVKLNDHLKEDMTAVHKQTNLRGLWENSRIIFQNSRSTQKCKYMYMKECVVCSVITE